MIKVHINDSSRENKNITESWINQQINERMNDGVPVCVKVEIDEGNICVGLSTPSCTRTRGRRRLPRADEKVVFDLWDKYKLNTNDFRGVNLVAFLKKINML